MILITRPRENAKETVNFLKAKKINYFLYPLSELSIKNKSLTIRNEVLIISSFKVIEFLKKKNMISLIRKSPLLIVGNKTSRYFKELKYKVLFTASNSETLTKYVKTNLKKSVKLKFLCSNVYNKRFVNELRCSGFSLQLTRVYRTEEVPIMSLKLQRHLNNGKIKNILFYSTFAVKVFFKLLKVHKIDSSQAKDIKFLCLSKRIASTIPQKYNKTEKVITAKETSDALQYFLKALRS
mgnify:CR=1 FL=1